MKWVTISRNERIATVNGRHYFACRCPGRLWSIEELNQSAVHMSKTIGLIGKEMTTREITKWLKTTSTTI